MLEVTGAEELQYIGHSMGTTGFMAMHHYNTDIPQRFSFLWFLYEILLLDQMLSKFIALLFKLLF